MLNTKEHYYLLEAFERDFSEERLDREKDKELWKKGILYESGNTNNLFLAYRLGYSLGKTQNE